MSYLYSCSTIRPECIHTDNSWDLHPFLPEAATFFQTRESIERFGLLYMPLILPVGDGGYECITGRRSYRFLQAIGHITEIPCRVLAEDLSTVQLLGLFYEEHASRKPLTEIELAHYLRLCRLKLDADDQRTLFATLNLPVKAHALNRVLALLSLESPVQEALMTGVIAENIARELLRLSALDRTVVFSLFLQLNIGGGKQKRLLTLLRDLAGREGISLKEYIEGEPFQAILNHPEMNIPQKSQSLLQLLQHNHTPSLSEAESRFTGWKKGLALPDNCTVSHSPAFEQDSVTLSVTFTSRVQLEDCLKEMQPHFFKA